MVVLLSLLCGAAAWGFFSSLRELAAIKKARAREQDAENRAIAAVARLAEARRRAKDQSFEDNVREWTK